jgi:DNA-binding MarR family transcriptional regulator
MMDLVAWLNHKGYKITKNVFLGSKIPDLIAYKKNEILAFEEKKNASEITDAIGQCLHYLEEANKVIIVLPKKEISFISQETLNVLRRHGIGLIENGKNIDILITPKKFISKNKRILKELSKKEVKYKKSTQLTEKLKDKIIEILKKNPEGLTILDISRTLGVNRGTVTKYIYQLSGANLITHRKIGTAKLCFLVKKGEKRKEVLL